MRPVAVPTVVAAVLVLLGGCGTVEAVTADEPGAPADGGPSGAPDESAAACASISAHDFPAGFKGYKRLGEAVHPGWGRPDSVTFRREGPNKAIVRVKTAKAPAGVQLQLLFAVREAGRWKVGGSTEGPLGCDSLEREFARPGKPLRLSDPEPPPARRAPSRRAQDHVRGANPGP